MQWNEIKYGEWPEHKQKVLIQIDNLYFVARFNAEECCFTWCEDPNIQWGAPKAPIRWTAIVSPGRLRYEDPALLRAWHLMSNATVRLLSLF